MKKAKEIFAVAVLLLIVAGCIGGYIWFQNWPLRFKGELDNFFGEGNWEYVKDETKMSSMYTTLRNDDVYGPTEEAGWYKNWYITFKNRYGEEKVWYITNHVYKINNDKYDFFTGKRLSAKQALTLELKEITSELIGEEVMNEIILDVLTEEEASCMNVRLSHQGGNPKPKFYTALLKEPWFKVNEVSAADYLANDLHDFHLDIRVHGYKFKELTEEQQQNVLDSFEVIQEKLKEAYGEDTAYDMYWGEGLRAEYGL